MGPCVGLWGIAGHSWCRKDKSYGVKLWQRRLRTAAGEGLGSSGGHWLPTAGAFCEQVRDVALELGRGVSSCPQGEGSAVLRIIIRAAEDFKA